MPIARLITGEWLLGLSGVASIALGVSIMLSPGPGALALVLWTGGYAIVIGVLFMGLLSIATPCCSACRLVRGRCIRAAEGEPGAVLDRRLSPARRCYEPLQAVDTPGVQWDCRQ